MQGLRWTIWAFGGLMIAVVAKTTVWGQFPTRPYAQSAILRTSPPTSRTQSQLPKRSYVAIMGRVQHPGVFETTKSPIHLKDLIRRAGGMLPDAHGSVRIIRGGRVAFQAFPTPRSQIAILDGDLVVVDGSSKQRNRIGKSIDFRKSNRSGSVASANSENSGVEIALLGILNRPVLMRIRERHATVSAMLALLGQPRSIANHLHLIRTKRRFAQSQPRKTDSQLQSGDILVFTPSKVIQTQVPPLPRAIPWKQVEQIRPSSLQNDTLPERNTSKPTGKYIRSRTKSPRPAKNPIIRTGGDYSESSFPQVSVDQFSEIARRREKQRIRKLLHSARENLRNGNLRTAYEQAEMARLSDIGYDVLEDRPELVLADIQKALQRNRSSTESTGTHTFGQPVSPKNIQPVNGESTSNLSSSPVLPARPLTENLSDGSTSRDNQQKQLSSQPPKPFASQSDVLRIPTIEEMSSEETNSSLVAAEEIAPEDNAKPEEVPPLFSTNMLLMMAAVFVAVILIGVVYSRRTRSTPKTKTKKPSAKNKSRLERLLQDEFPIQEESLKLPTSLELQGQLVDPTPQRIDMSHQSPRPHFQPRVSGQNSTPQQTLRTENVHPAPPAPKGSDNPPQTVLGKVNLKPKPNPRTQTESGQAESIDQKHETPSPHTSTVDSIENVPSNLASRLAPTDAISRALASSLRRAPHSKEES